VVLDLHRLSYMDTTGQRELLLFWRRSRAEHFNLSLIGVSQDLRERMRITGVDKLLRLA
jgi:anti-anti-sigma factor